MFNAFLNTYFDHVYYDVSAVSENELRKLPTLGDQPLLLCAQPGGRLAAYASLAEMKLAGPIPRVVALPGAVSATLGAAALARNIADALAQPVCVLVPGAPNPGWCGQFLPWLTLAPARSHLDLLREILTDPQIEVSHLLGHSKGSADLSQVLHDLEQNGWPTHLDPTVITVGGVVDLPARLAKVQQLLGEYDWLGYFNSRTDLEYQCVAHSGHHLNRQLPCHFDLVRELSARS